MSYLLNSASAGYSKYVMRWILGYTEVCFPTYCCKVVKQAGDGLYAFQRPSCIDL